MANYDSLAKATSAVDSDQRGRNYQTEIVKLRRSVRVENDSCHCRIVLYRMKLRTFALHEHQTYLAPQHHVQAVESSAALHQERWDRSDQAFVSFSMRAQSLCDLHTRSLA